MATVFLLISQCPLYVLGGVECSRSILFLRPHGLLKSCEQTDLLILLYLQARLLVAGSALGLANCRLLILPQDLPWLIWGEQMWYNLPSLGFFVDFC